MSKEERKKKSEGRESFKGFPFTERIRKMMEGGGSRCDCAQMMAMMSKYCGTKEENEPLHESSAAGDKQASK